MLRFIGCFGLLWLISLRLVAQTAQIHFLSGSDKDNLAQWDFFIDKGRKAGSLHKINVPSCWETEGFGMHGAENDQQAVYKHAFIALPQWQGKHVNLVFEGVLTLATVKLNGQVIGMHEGAYEPFSFDVSERLLWGARNELEVIVQKVARQLPNSSEQVCSGIYKPVYLEILPPIHITRLFTEARADGTLRARVFVNRRDNLQVSAHLQDLQGNLIGKPVTSKAIKNFSDNQPGFELAAVFEGIREWSAELPQRYRLIVELQNRQGAELHRISTVVGFCSVSAQKDGLYLNGKKIKLQAVGYRGFWHESGLSIGRQVSELDALLLKELNANAIYCYSPLPDNHLLDVCDSLGLYVICRASAKTTSLTPPVVNHPCAILLSETPPAPFETLRPVMPKEALNVLTVLNDELFKKTWQETLNGSAYGMLLPYFADESYKGENDKRLPNAVFTDAGVTDVYRKPKAIYYAVKEWWSPVKVNTDTADGLFRGTLSLTNGFAFTNLNRCRFTRQLATVRMPSDECPAGELQIRTSATDFLPDVAPGSSGKISLNLPADWQSYDLLSITVFAPAGNEIYTWRFPLTAPENYLSQWAIGAFSDVPQSVRKTAEGWELAGEEFKVTVHANGHIVRITARNGMPILQGLPFKDVPAEVSENPKGTLNFRFSVGAPVQSVSYTLSEAGVLRIRYTGENLGFLCPGSLSDWSVFAAGPFPEGITAGAPLGLVRQKNPDWQGTYRRLYWAKWQTAGLPLTLMTTHPNAWLQLQPGGKFFIGQTSGTDCTVYLKSGN